MLQGGFWGGDILLFKAHLSVSVEWVCVFSCSYEQKTENRMQIWQLNLQKY